MNDIMGPSSACHMWTGAVMAILCPLSLPPKMYPAILLKPPLVPPHPVPGASSLACIEPAYLLTSNRLYSLRTSNSGSS